MEILDLLPDWQRHLRARNRQDRTVETYSEAVVLLDRFLRERGMPTDAAEIRKAHMEAFLEDQTKGRMRNGKKRSPSTAAGRYRYLRQFTKWCLAEAEADVDPMEGISQPHIPDKPVPTVDTDDLTKLLKACEGRSFEARRDMAILSLFVDSGVRLGEMTGIEVGDVHLDDHSVTVLGKGNRERDAFFGRQTAEALSRYLRARRRHQRAHLAALWLSSKGALTSSGIAQMLRRRCDDAGIQRLHPHQFRHTVAHQWLSHPDGKEGDLMQVMGWRDPAMLRHYARSAAAARAKKAHASLSLRDRI